MPVAIAVGRRIVLLSATALLILATALCAFANTYEWHLAARMVLGLAAGQSEALVPMIVQVSLLSGNRVVFLTLHRNVTSFTSEVIILWFNNSFKLC